jgi:hypothetical protein
MDSASCKLYFAGYAWVLPRRISAYMLKSRSEKIRKSWMDMRSWGNTAREAYQGAKATLLLVTEGRDDEITYRTSPGLNWGVKSITLPWSSLGCEKSTVANMVAIPNHTEASPACRPIEGGIGSSHVIWQ